MTIPALLESLKKYLESVTADLLFPVAIQKGDEAEAERPPEIHKMRLPDENAAKKYVPYILIQWTNARDQRPAGLPAESSAGVRLIFCVTDQDSERGAAELVNLLETVRVAILRDTVIDDRYAVDMEAGIDCAPFVEDTAPYFAGEMNLTFRLAPIERDEKWQR